MAISFRAISFQDSSTACDGLGAGFTAVSFFMASWACPGSDDAVTASIAAIIKIALFIAYSSDVWFTGGRNLSGNRGMRTVDLQSSGQRQLCIVLLAYKVPAVGRISRFSTVALAGRRIAPMTAWATVAGDIILLRGASGQSVFQISVSVAPGSRPITRIPFGRSSWRRVLVKPSAPCFDAL